MTEQTEQATAASPKTGKMGCATLIGVLVIMLVLGLGFNEAIGFYSTHCSDKNIIECLTQNDVGPETNGVTSKGTYVYKEYSAELTLIIPLEGGNVTGEVMGACTGTVDGKYDGNDNGVISGTLTGYCDPFFVKIPATGTFTGSVQKTAKNVPISVKGKAPGVEKEGSMTLTF